jgi:seipin
MHLCSALHAHLNASQGGIKTRGIEAATHSIDLVCVRMSAGEGAKKPSLLEEDWIAFSARVRGVCKRSAKITLNAAFTSLVLLLLSIFTVLLVRFVVVPRGPVSLTQDLVFDYTTQAPLARASFLEEKFANVPVNFQEDSSKRILRPKQSFDIDVEFTVPESDFNVNVGMFQVNVKLLTPGGKLLLESSRPGIVKYTSKEVKWLRTIVWWPFHALGLIEEQQNVRVTMVKNYQEDSETPFTDIQVIMKPHAGSSKLPQIYEACATIHLSMNIFAKALYFYPLTSFVVLVSLLWSGLNFTAFSLSVISLLVMGSNMEVPSTTTASGSVTTSKSKYDTMIADGVDLAKASQAGSPPVSEVTRDLLDDGLRRRNVAGS